MAPRKKPSSSSKKPSQNDHSQPSKFGIQHFFERHSQSQALASTPPPPPPPPPPNPPLSQQNPSQKTPKKTSPQLSDHADDPAEITPEFSKAKPLKRFRFSPGMLIKQSQDDGGDEVTWRISPVNERLQAASKHLPDTTRILSDASKINAPDLRLCSEKKVQSSPSVVMLEKWLSSPTLKVPERSVVLSRRVSFQAVDPDKDKKVFNSSYGCVRNLNGSSTVSLQSPFRTPPSVSYNPDESGDGFIDKGTSDQLGSRHHRKALLELLDQVEDVISVEEPLPNNSGPIVSANQNALVGDQSIVDDPSCKTLACMRSERASSSHSNLNFLVLEVAEKRRTVDSSHAQNPFKVLRLFNEQSGEERALHLYDDWFYCLIGPGDTVNVIGEFDNQGRCVVDHEKNLVIVHPDILVSGTRVAASFSCPRRTVLDERIKSNEHSVAALVGTLLHQIFQAGLLQDSPTRGFLEEYAGTVLQKNIESLYAAEVNDNDIHAMLIEAIPRLLNWINCFRGIQEPKVPTVDFGTNDEQKAIGINEVIDIEEMAWSPRYGLKGMVDASLRVKVNSENGGSEEKIMPLEFKTGKGTSGQSGVEHSAQVILYTLLMSDRYMQDIDSGLLYYHHTDQTKGIAVRRSDLVGLVMRRNAHATDVLKASTVQLLPPMLRSLNMCRGCRHLSACTIYHKAHGGTTESSGLGELFDSNIEHLAVAHFNFLKQWDRLIDLEAKVSQVAKKAIWHPHDTKREHRGLTSMILDVSNDSSPKISLKDGRFIYRFVRQDCARNNFELKNGDSLLGTPGIPVMSDVDCTLKCGDYVILGTMSGRVAVANGVIAEINQIHVSISFSRRLRLPGSRSSSEVDDLIQEVWRIDKDEVASSFAIMRFNLIQLFAQSARSSHLRQIIVDLEIPRFDSGVISSQDPAISYIRSEKNLNDDQRRAIHKILTAKDYALILGMPGTGKTSTMVHAVKALLMRGASILLTSYTNSAVDNLLIKLKAQGIDFFRIGRVEAVHDEIQEHCFPAMNINSVKDVKLKMEQANVVGVTCLGINHPLLTNKKFDICIMDEAGQITLPVSLGPLMLASTFVLVGDHYQLPPLVQSTEARENGMGVSLFCRLSEAHPQAISALQCQYRMCAGIMELANALIYGNRLRCGSSEVANARLEVLASPSIPSWLKAVLDPNRSSIFINTDMLPALESKEHKVINNSTEAHIVSEITHVLLNGGIVDDEIGIITPYNSQANLIRSLVGMSHVEIHTIDKYQGRDKDCILLSFVRSLENPRACTSSLLGDWHRINVAITRAKRKLIMVGSQRTLSRVPLLRLLIEKVEKQTGILNISKKDLHHSRELKKCSQLTVQ